MLTGKAEANVMTDKTFAFTESFKSGKMLVYDERTGETKMIDTPKYELIVAKSTTEIGE